MMNRIRRERFETVPYKCHPLSPFPSPLRGKGGGEILDISALDLEPSV